MRLLHPRHRLPAVLLPLLAALPARGADFGSTESGSAPAPARLRMAAETLDRTDPRACVTAAAEMANEENLEGFLECFATSSQKKLRKEAALVFARHDVSMDLLDAHVIRETPTKGEVAVRYRARLSDSSYDVVSVVAVKREAGYWKISSEQVQEYEYQSPRSCHPSRYTCLGGTCRVATR